MVMEFAVSAVWLVSDNDSIDGTAAATMGLKNTAKVIMRPNVPWAWCNMKKTQAICFFSSSFPLVI